MTAARFGTSGHDAELPAGSSAFAASGTTQTVIDPPTIATGPWVSATPVNSATLNVLGADDAGESNLTYTWNVVSSPSGGSVYLSDGGDNTAKTVTATFSEAGDYDFTVTITDPSGLSVTSDVLDITVNQVLSGVVVTPDAAAMLAGQTQQFTASGADQFGNDMTISPDWTVSGSGTISPEGVYTAAAGSGETTDTVTASVDGQSATASAVVKVFDSSDAVNAGDEFFIGTGGTFTVPEGATTLYLGMHDGGCWTDDWGTMNTTLTWNVGGSSTESVTSGCVFFAQTPSNAPTIGPWYEYYRSALYDHPGDCGPDSVSIPPGATSVTITASGTTWGWGGGDGGDESDYQCGPDGSGPEGCTDPRYMAAAYNSENMASCDCANGSLVGLFNAGVKLLELHVTDPTDPINQATATDSAIKDLYVGEGASTQSAAVDLSTIFAPAAAGGYLHLEITRSDGDVIEETSGAGPGEVTLPVTATAHDFAIKAWLDVEQSDGSVVAQQTVEVDVHVVEGAWYCIMTVLTVAARFPPTKKQARAATSVWTTIPRTSRFQWT